MKWKAKAALQNIVELLPASYAIYYWLQRSLGGLRRIKPTNRLAAGMEICRRTKKTGHSPIGKTFFEIGTGRRVNIALALWLGAEEVITVDLNPYLREELVREDITFIQKNEGEIRTLLAQHLHGNRLSNLLDMGKGKWNLGELLESCKIEYVAPADAANMGLLSDESVDYYVSYTVLEHIPPQVLLDLLEEGNRIVKSQGLFIHRIDYIDHFSHSDQSISCVNFLQFSDEEWEDIVKNRFMYIDRLRVDDFVRLFEHVGHKILVLESDKDPSAIEILSDNDVVIDGRFRGKPLARWRPLHLGSSLRDPA